MNFNFNYIKSVLSLVFVSALFTGCNKFVDVPDPIDQLPTSIVFESDTKAASAVRGLYGSMVAGNAGFFALNTAYAAGVTMSLGVSSDELIPVGGNTFTEFYENNISPTSGTNTDKLWGAIYNLIYTTNAVIENLDRSTGVTEAGRKQLSAEARFIRAANYFYLVNMYGNIPLALNTDYRANSNLPNVPSSKVYDQIIEDLKFAQENMSKSYPGVQRLRANKYAASALLARVYLYKEDWANAEATASLVIDEAGKSVYDVEPDLDKAFLTSSKEVILQLMQPGTNLYTYDGISFISSSIPTYQVPDSLFNFYELKDKRRTKWIKTNTVITNGKSKDYHHPFKYKINSGTGSVRTEALVFLRLGEVYLIRAEARAHLSKLNAAITDLDVIRNRAGIDKIIDVNPAITQPELLKAIEHERFLELFSELGHRWLDLKRTGKADEVLKYKQNWRPEAKLFPIPLADINTNPFLKQNPGYN